MSKMDRILNSKKDKQTIYEIYRACRLCGAGAGYKMPIIQNVIDLDDTDVELKQKIRDCVQIEVHQDDKMPPLICELCVDKVNDFYEFLEMCRQTNKRTRLRLGLPPQSMPRGAPDAGECILGLTEPVYVNEDSDGEPLAKHKKLQPRVKVKKEPELKVKLENRSLSDARSSRFKSTKRPPTPPRTTRHRNNSKDDNVSLNRMQDKSKSPKVTPKSILKKETKTEDSSLLTPRLKRSRDKDPVKLETPVKKVKIAVKPSHPTPRSSPKTSPRVSKLSKSPKSSPRRAASPPRQYKCGVCGQTFKTPQANISHMKIHVVNFTIPKLACDPCGVWFVSTEEATTHHKYHKSKSKPYTCRRCTADFKHLSAYEEHFDNNQCIPWSEVPDVKCDVCWHLFATNKLLEDHKCMGEDHRPGGKCCKCNRSYALLKNLKKHEQTCTARRRGELIVDPVLLGKLKPIQVRVSRCDPLLTNIKQEHYDVSSVTADFGLDKNCVYPYISSVSSLRIKSEPDDLDGMVAIKDEIKEEFCTEEDYVHWDSEDSESDEEVTCSLVLNPFAKTKKVDTLANLTLKTLFSRRCLGKVPKKRRRVKQEKNLFDSLLANETEEDVTRDINNIIDNLGDDEDLDDDKDRNGDGDKMVDDKVDGVDVTESMDVSGDKITDVGDENSIVDKNIDGDKDVDKNADVGNDENLQDSGNVDYKDAANKHLTDDNISNDKDDQINAQNDDNLSDVVDNADVVDKNDQIDTSNDVCNDQVSVEEEKDINSVTNDSNSVCDDAIRSNNNISSNSNNNDDLSQISKGNNGSINNISDASNNEIDLKLNITSEVSKNENQNEGVNIIDDSSTKNDTDDLSSKNDIENSQDSNSISILLNDNTQSDVISENEKESIDNIDISDNATSLPDNPEIDEIKSHSLDSKISESEIVLEANDKDVEGSQGKQLNDNDYKKSISVVVNNDKSKKNSDSEDMDDRKLMEALDAQIGENHEQNDNFNDKIALEDLISHRNTEIDIIPDEFNFDA